MSESRDANDPRDLMRAMRKEEQEEFERDEANDTGGQERVSRARGGESPARRPVEAARSTAPRAPDDADARRAPGGDDAEAAAREASAPEHLPPSLRRE
jgi:hypothetical protein